MGVYALAFIAFTLDLARRSARAEVVAETGAERIARARAGGMLATLEKPPAVAPPAPKASVSLRVGVALAVLGWVLHLGATVLRGVAASRVPWANMYEFAMTGTLLMMGVFLVLLVRRDLRFLGAIMTGLVVILLGIATVGFRVDVVPLPPALQSYWLVIHVLVAILATAFYTVGFALSLVQLMQARRESGRAVRFRLP